MQYIDNDMDELFNKAGRDYPLKTDNGNWDAVFNRLQSGAAPGPMPPKTNRRYYWLLLLLLLPLSYLLVGDNGINKEGSHRLTENKAEINKKGTSPVINKNNAAGNKVANDKAENANTNIHQSEKNKPISTNTININNTATPDEIGNGSSGSHLFAVPGDGNRVWDLHHIPVSYSLSPYSIIPPPIKTADSPAIKKPRSVRISKLYAGLLVGPDLSTIKYQKINNAGFSVGILAGYKFSNHWSVEAGVLYNRKKYYTDGKYFDKSGTNIPPSVTINYLDGTCQMFEVPISVRYNLSVKENTFFATAGITSYFMNEEEYDYLAYAAGSWYEGHRSYKNSGNHIFSNMQLSIGYNYKISNKLSVRIEPYIKIPVQDIGIGNLPVTSTGVYFGIMRNIR